MISEEEEKPKEKLSQEINENCVIGVGNANSLKFLEESSGKMVNEFKLEDSSCGTSVICLPHSGKGGAFVYYLVSCYNGEIGIYNTKLAKRPDKKVNEKNEALRHLLEPIVRYNEGFTNRIIRTELLKKNPNYFISAIETRGLRMFKIPNDLGKYKKKFSVEECEIFKGTESRKIFGVKDLNPYLNQLLTVCTGGYISLIDVEKLKTISSHLWKKGFLCMETTKDCKMAFCGGFEGNVCMVDPRMDLKKSIKKYFRIRETDGEVTANCLLVNEQRRLVLCGTYSGKLHYFDYRNPKKELFNIEAQEPGNYYSSLEYINNERFISASCDHHIKSFDFEGKKLWGTDKHEWIYDLCYLGGFGYVSGLKRWNEDTSERIEFLNNEEGYSDFAIKIEGNSIEMFKILL